MRRIIRPRRRPPRMPATQASVIADGAVGDPTTQYEVVPGQPADRTGPRVPEVDTWRKIDGEINDVYRRYGVAPADRQVRYGEKRLDAPRADRRGLVSRRR